MLLYTPASTHALMAGRLSSFTDRLSAYFNSPGWKKMYLGKCQKDACSHEWWIQRHETASIFAMLITEDLKICSCRIILERQYPCIKSKRTTHVTSYMSHIRFDEKIIIKWMHITKCKLPYSHKKTQIYSACLVNENGEKEQSKYNRN